MPCQEDTMDVKQNIPTTSSAADSEDMNVIPLPRGKKGSVVETQSTIVVPVALEQKKSNVAETRSSILFPTTPEPKKCTPTENLSPPGTAGKLEDKKGTPTLSSPAVAEKSEDKKGSSIDKSPLSQVPQERTSCSSPIETSSTTLESTQLERKISTCSETEESLAYSPFIGHWKTESLENWDEFMKATGVGFLARKFGKNFSIREEIRLEGSIWILIVLTPIMNKEVRFQIGVEFQETSLDGSVFQGVASLDKCGKRITVVQRSQLDPRFKFTIVREILPDGRMLETVSCNTTRVKCKRHLVRCPSPNATPV